MSINFEHLDMLIEKEAAFSQSPGLTRGEHADSLTRLRNLKTCRDVLYHNSKGHLVYIGPRGLMITGDGRV